MTAQNLTVACPDPSMHRDTKLQEQASTAALYVTSPMRQKTDAGDILDKNQKLSSKSAATSLKYARPEDLPSYPSSGGLTANNSNSAAHLAHANQKPFEHWKPDPSSNASKAALLAKDYQMAPLWKPGMSEAGSKAALLAHRDGGKLDLWSPQASPQGNTAATLAFRKSASGQPPAQTATSSGPNKALMAATKSVGRNRAGSLPTAVQPTYPDSKNSAKNALNAATAANRKSSVRNKQDDTYDSPAMEESRIKHLSDKISRDMFTEHPPIAWEVEEKKHQDALRASAVSMAKGMYDLAEREDKQRSATQGATAASRAANRQSTGPQPDLRQQAMQYIHLQEAAHRLAEERLAKLDPDGSARYREHYGYPLRSPRRKLSIRDKVRRRAKSESEGKLADSDSDDDEFTSRRIRRQMSQFNKEVESVDQKKRSTDRAALLAAAEKKVQAQMHSIDEKVYAETGKVSPAMMEQWEVKAREKAAKDSAKRTENYGKADIGGGKFMEQSEVEAIAAARLKPTLDEINENAEKRRARDEEIRLDIEERKRQAMNEKQKEKEHKAIAKRTKEEEKAAAKQEKAQQKAAQKQEKEQHKAAAKMEKEAGKARKADEKKTAEDDKRRSNDVKKDVAVATAASAAVHEADDEKKVKTSEELEPTSIGDIAFIPTSFGDSPLSPVESRSPTGDPILRGSIERHISHIQDSEDEALPSDDDEIADTNSAPEADRAVTSTDGEAPKISSEKHVGTDGEIGKAAPAALALAAGEAAKSKDDKEAEASSPKSPNKSGFGRLMDRFRRKSKHDTEDQPGTLSKLKRRSVMKQDEEKVTSPTSAEVANEKSSEAEDATEDVKATVSPTEPTLAPLSAVEAKAVASQHADAAAASPSSFVRGAGTENKSEISSLSGLTSDEEGEDLDLTLRDPSKGDEDFPIDGEKKGKGKRGLLGLGIGTQKEQRGSLEAGRSPVRETRFQEEL